MRLDSYADAGVHVAIDLVNRLVVQPDGGERLDTLARILAVDPGSVKQVRDEHVPGFVALGEQLHSVVADLARGDDDAAATRLNAMLSAHPAHPHLAKEDGRWRMHHHPSDAPPVQMWTSICAEALGRLLAAGHGHRVGVCSDPNCGRAYVDTSRNHTRRFCSTTCQNRAKTAALRQRRRNALLAAESSERDRHRS